MIQQFLDLNGSIIQKSNEHHQQLDFYEDITSIVNRQEIILGGAESMKMSLLDRHYTDDEINYFWGILSKDDQEFFMGTGKYQGQGYWNPEINDVDAAGNKPTVGRGKYTLKLWLEQGGRCAYTGKGPISPKDMVIDHTEKHPTKGKWDHPSVMVWASLNVNGNKGANSIQDFVNRMIKEYSVGEKLHEEKVKKQSKNTLIKKYWKEIILNSESIEEIRDYYENMFGIISSNIPKSAKHYIFRYLGVERIAPGRSGSVSGERQTGGCKGDYSALSGTFALEIMYGNEDKAREGHKKARDVCKKYLDMIITSAEMATQYADIIETFDQIWYTYNRERFIQMVIKNNP